MEGAPPPQGPPWKLGHTLALVVIVAGIVLVGLVLPWAVDLEDDGDATHVVLWTWLALAALLAAFIAVAGHGITRLWRGALIDERNRMSLARLQIAAWTVLILSAFLAAALANVGAGESDPLAIALPTELWLAMGISTTSLVGSALILGDKKNRPRSEVEEDRMMSDLVAQGAAPRGIRIWGLVVGHTEPREASWSDLFLGDETGTYSHLDLGKIQMFFFTVVLVLAYAVGLGELFVDTTDKIREFPKLDEAMIALLGISHGGYLTKKAIPQTKTSDQG